MEHWRKKDNFTFPQYLSMLFVPLVLGVVLSVGISVLMTAQLQTFGEAKALHFENEATYLFREVEIISSSIISDSAVSRELISENSYYPLSLCEDLRSYKDRCDFINSIYIICNNGTILSSNGRYTKDSLEIILAKIGESRSSFAAATEDETSGWHIGLTGIVEPYYVDYLRDGNEIAGQLIIILNTSPLHNVLTESNVAICCIYDNDHYISSRGSGSSSTDWSSDTEVSKLLHEKVRCFVFHTSDFNYMVAVPVRSFYLPIRIIVFLFAAYLLMVLIIGLIQSAKKQRKDQKRIADVIEKLPHKIQSNASYEEILSAVGDALGHYSDVEQFYRYEQQSNSLRFILGGYVQSQVTEKMLCTAGVQVGCAGYHVASIFITDYTDMFFDERDEMENRNIALLIFSSALQIVAKQTASTSCCHIDGNFAIVFSHTESDENDYGVKRMLTEFLNFLESNYGLNIQTTINSWIESPDQLSSSYIQTQDLFSLSHELDVNTQVLASQDLNEGWASSDSDYLKGIQVLINALMLKKYDIISGLVKNILDKHMASFTGYSSLYHNRLISLEDILCEGISGAELSAQDIFRHTADIRSATTSDALQRITDELFGHLSKIHNSSNVLGVVEKTCAYIRANLQDQSLNVAMICEQMDISIQHLSRLFRKHLSKTISEYINECRIDFSKTLIAEGGKSMSIIASTVGYGSTDSFYRNFKKIEGITPSEYSKIFHHTMKT